MRSYTKKKRQEMRRGVERTRTRKLDEVKETENEDRSGKNKNEELHE